jgi:hypothetical protein
VSVSKFIDNRTIAESMEELQAILQDTELFPSPVRNIVIIIVYTTDAKRQDIFKELQKESLGTGIWRRALQCHNNCERPEPSWRFMAWP